MPSPSSATPINQPAGDVKTRLHNHLKLARISNSPTVVSNALAGAALATTLVFDSTIVCIALAMILFYTAGMYLNDILDYEIDLKQRSSRPLPSGALSKTEAWAVTALLFLIGLLLLGAAGTRAMLSGIVLIGAIALYDAWHKGNAAGPFLMGATRVLVYVTAFLAYSSDVSWLLGIWSVVMLFYIAGLTSIAKTEDGPSLTRFWPVISLFPAIPVALIDHPSRLTAALSAAFFAWTIYCLSFVFRTEGKSIGGAIGRLIAGVSLLDALVLASREESWGVAIALGCFALTIFLQRYIRGT